MLRLVSSGVGNCILPSRIPDKLLADYDLRKLPMENHSLSRWVVAITPTERPLSSLASPFVQCALEVAGELRSESSE
jgi:DNA-binding transcriptional LysR family regulator